MQKQLSLEQMSQISGGTFSWSEFFHGACQAVGVMGVLTGSLVIGGAGVLCTLSGV